MAIAWALLAVSSEQQSGTLRHQKAWAEGVCTEKGWRLTRFVEGVASGKDGPRRLSRDLLLEIRATAPEARPAYVLMIRLDRVGRGSIVDSQIFVRDMLALGTRIYTRDHGEIRLDSAMDELIAAVQLAVARHENDVRSDKAKAWYKRRKEAGQVISNRAPYGLRINAERQFESRPEYAPAIRKAFQMLAGGTRLMDVVRWLQSNSEPHRYGNGTEYAVRWSDRRLAVMIAQRGYIGTVVDEKTWLRAQRQRIERSVGKSPPADRDFTNFVLAKVFRCTCGRRIAYVVNTSTSGRLHRYYLCRPAWTHERAQYHRADDLEKRFADFLQALAREPMLTAPSSNATQVARLGAAVASIRERLDKIELKRTRVWRLDDAGHLTINDLEQRMQSLNETKRELETRLVALIEERAHLKSLFEHDDFTERLRREAYAGFIGADDLQKNVIARAVSASFGGLRISKGGRILIGPKPDQVWLRKKHAGEI